MAVLCICTAEMIFLNHTEFYFFTNVNVGIPDSAWIVQYGPSFNLVLDIDACRQTLCSSHQLEHAVTQLASPFLSACPFHPFHPPPVSTFLLCPQVAPRLVSLQFCNGLPFHHYHHHFKGAIQAEVGSPLTFLWPPTPHCVVMVVAFEICRSGDQACLAR